jgi:GT2 family glycosyltransferase
VHPALYFALVAPAALLFAYTLGSTIAGLGRLRRVADTAPDLESWPKLSIVTPACNEERDVEAAMLGVLAADYPSLEVVAVDDRSTDRTGEILDAIASRDRRLAVHHVTELPEGWLGKLNALQLGVERSSGEWLLFMDADVVLAPGALQQAVADATRRDLDLLSVVPTIESAGWLSGAVFGVSLATLSAGGRLQGVRRADSEAVAATGAFILVRRSALARTPGFAWIKLEVADDFGLCLLIKKHGGRCDIVNGRGAVKLDWYPSFREMTHAMQKNLFAILGRFSVPRMVGLASVLVLLGAQPLALLLPVPLAWRLVPAAGLASLMLAVWLSGRWTGRSRSGAWLAPLALLGMSWMVIRAAYVGHRVGGIVWRGVVYPTRRFAANQRVRV